MLTALGLGLFELVLVGFLYEMLAHRDEVFDRFINNYYWPILVDVLLLVFSTQEWSKMSKGYVLVCEYIAYVVGFTAIIIGLMSQLVYANRGRPE